MMEQWNNKDEVMADDEVGEKEGEEVSLIFVIVFCFISFSDDILKTKSDNFPLEHVWLFFTTKKGGITHSCDRVYLLCHYSLLVS